MKITPVGTPIKPGNHSPRNIFTEDGLKICVDCREPKELTEFYYQNKALGTRSARCKKCALTAMKAWRNKNLDYETNRNLSKNYNLSLDDYNALLVAQSHCCAICGKHESQNDVGNRGTKKLAVDHDHVTGAIRGLLCTKCNTGLGAFQDNIETLLAAALYIEKFRNGHE